MIGVHLIHDRPHKDYLDSWGVSAGFELGRKVNIARLGIPEWKDLYFAGAVMGRRLPGRHWK